VEAKNGALGAAGVPEVDQGLRELGQREGYGHEEQEEEQPPSVEQSPGRGQEHQQVLPQAEEAYPEQARERERGQGGVPLQRTETVPESFLWGESEVVPRDWLEWPPQRTPRSISQHPPGVLRASHRVRRGGGRRERRRRSRGVFPLGPMGVPQAHQGRLHSPAAAAVGGGGDHGKQPTFVRRSRRRGAPAACGAPGPPQHPPARAQQGRRPCLLLPLRPTLSEGLSSQAGSEQEATIPQLAEGTGAANGGRQEVVGPGARLGRGADWAAVYPNGSLLIYRTHGCPSLCGQPPSPRCKRPGPPQGVGGGVPRVEPGGREEEERRDCPGAAGAGGSREVAGAKAALPAWALGEAQEGTLLRSYNEGAMAPHQEDTRQSLVSPARQGTRPEPRAAQGRAGLRAGRGRGEPEQHQPCGVTAGGQAAADPSCGPSARPPLGPLWVYPFSWEQLFLATNGLSPALRISRKPTFSVYRGQLQDGREVTVKVLSEQGDAAAEARLWAEARALSNVRHRNLIELLGVCHPEGTGTGTGAGAGSAGGAKAESPRAQAVVYEYVDGTALTRGLRCRYSNNLYCTPLYWTLLYCILLYCTVLYMILGFILICLPLLKLARLVLLVLYLCLPFLPRLRLPPALGAAPQGGLLDVAQAIMYLHTGLPELTPHGSVTSANVVLLKDSLAAKVWAAHCALCAVCRMLCAGWCFCGEKQLCCVPFVL